MRVQLAVCYHIRRWIESKMRRKSTELHQQAGFSAQADQAVNSAGGRQKRRFATRDNSQMPRPAKSPKIEPMEKAMK